MVYSSHGNNCQSIIGNLVLSLKTFFCPALCPFKHTPTLYPHFIHPPIHTLHACIHHYTAALQVRLVGGNSNPFSGRVEYFLQGIWATVCDDYFGIEDGNVVCNQLGYGNATGTPSFGAGSGSIAFDDLDCTGDEISLLFCPHLGNFQHNCGHNEDVGVTCQGECAC